MDSSAWEIMRKWSEMQWTSSTFGQLFRIYLRMKVFHCFHCHVILPYLENRKFLPTVANFCILMPYRALTPSCSSAKHPARLATIVGLRCSHTSCRFVCIFTSNWPFSCSHTWSLLSPALACSRPCDSTTFVREPQTFPSRARAKTLLEARKVVETRRQWRRPHRRQSMLWRSQSLNRAPQWTTCCCINKRPQGHNIIGIPTVPNVMSSGWTWATMLAM